MCVCGGGGGGEGKKYPKNWDQDPKAQFRTEECPWPTYALAIKDHTKWSPTQW